jgi:hypothetical protein
MGLVGPAKEAHGTSKSKVKVSVRAECGALHLPAVQITSLEMSVG